MEPLFIDFETNKSGKFYLVGISDDSTFKQIILNNELKGLAEEKNIEIKKSEDFLNETIEKIIRNNSTIVAYGEHEKNLIKKHLKKEHINKINYLNIHKAIRKYIRRTKGMLELYRSFYDDLPNNFQNKRYSLINVMYFFTKVKPSDYAIGLTTGRLNTVINALNIRNQVYSRLTPVQKAKATKALKHNKYDVSSIKWMLAKLSKESPKLIKEFTTKIP